MSLSISRERSDFYRDQLLPVHTGLLSSAPASLLTGTGILMEGKRLAPNDTIDLGVDQELLVSVEDFAHLFWVFNDSRVQYQRDHQHRSVYAPAGMYATVINPGLIKQGCKNKLGLVSVDGSGGLSLSGVFVDLCMLRDDAPSLLGAVAFGLCAMRAFLLGIDNISLVAAGGDGYKKQYFGFMVWPKFGFDAPLLPGEFHDERAPELASCKTVLEAVATSPESWSSYGSQRIMTFDLEPRSHSWATLVKYLETKCLWSAI